MEADHNHHPHHHMRTGATEDAGPRSGFPLLRRDRVNGECQRERETLCLSYSFSTGSTHSSQQENTGSSFMLIFLFGVF